MLNRSIRRFALTAITIVSATVLTALGAGGASAAATAGSQAAPLSKNPPATATPPQLTLQDAVQSLGATTYRDAYGGMTVSPTTQESAVPSHITIYVVTAATDATQFLSAVRKAAATPGGRATSYSIVDVRHSFAELYALTLKIARQR